MHILHHSTQYASNGYYGRDATRMHPNSIEPPARPRPPPTPLKSSRCHPRDFSSPPRLQVSGLGLAPENPGRPPSNHQSSITLLLKDLGVGGMRHRISPSTKGP